MRVRLLLFFLALLLFVEGYLLGGMAALAGWLPSPWTEFVLTVYYALTAIQWLGVFAPLALRISRASAVAQRSFTVSLTLLAAKLSAAVVLLLLDMARVAVGLIATVGREGGLHLPERSSYALLLVAIVFLIVIGAMAFGATRGRYWYRVRRIVVRLPGLPPAFEGYTLTHFTDAHSGSWSHPERVRRGFEKINALNADAICFTGDIVNNTAEELTPYLSLYASLRARDGVYSILGNHDYGDYVSWPSPEAKRKNLQQLKELQRSFGWKLLLNEHTVLEREGQRLYLAGVENWGAPPFPQYGDLQQALQGIPEGACTVLLSHDPTHWSRQVTQQAPDVALTLSGHTHAMQFGFRLGPIKWSPVSLRYKHWWGLYKQGVQQLYVSRGFGYLGFRGRVGMWPEIVHITLRRG